MRLDLLLTLIAVLGIASLVLAHAPQEAARDRYPVSPNQLDGLSRTLQSFAQKVVTDLSKEVNDVSQQAETIQRQQMLQNQNLSEGMGMKRWPQEQFDKKLAEAVSAANDLLAKFCQAMPSADVTFAADGSAKITPSGAIDGLAGRSEPLIVRVNNQTNQPLGFEVSGQVGNSPLSKAGGNAPAGGTGYAMAMFKAEKAGAFELALQVTAGPAGKAAAKLAGLAMPSCRLTVNLVDAATKKPTAARVFVHGADGRFFIVGDRTVFTAGGKNVQRFSYVDAKMVAVVPPGAVQIKAKRGFEYNLAEQTEDVQADKTVTLELTRWVDMPALGWYSGDTHEHWVTTDWYEDGDADWLNLHSKAEDIWVNNNLKLKHWWKGNKSVDMARYPNNPLLLVESGADPRKTANGAKVFDLPQGLVAVVPTAPVGKVDRYSTDGRIVWVAEEYRNDEIFGHMVFLRINKLIEPVSTGFMGGPKAVHYPPNSFTYDLVKAAGGISIAAHDVTKEVPIQVILGKLDSLDAYSTNRYYDLLNSGFHLPLSVGSDYPANLMGFARVYVNCGPKLDYNTWVDHLAAGQTFVSSGGVIQLEVDGQPIGGSVAIEPGAKRDIVVKGWAKGRTPLKHVEIIHNGQVVKTVATPQPSQEIKFEETISVQGPGWICARTQAGPQQGWWGVEGAAHTGPIYIRCGNERLVKADAVKRLIDVMKAGRADAAASDMYASPQQKAEILKYYDDGMAKYDDLLKQAK